MPISLEQFVQRLTSSGVLSSEELSDFQQNLSSDSPAASAQQLSAALVESGKLTAYQAEAIAAGQTKGLVFGEYVVLDEIGHGGMGQVLKARHRRMGRLAAIKILTAKALESNHGVERFRLEVLAAARLSHPNIVTAYDASEQDGIHYLAMEYVEGADLASVVCRCGPLDVESAVDCIAQVAKGLQYAHDEGIVHRDIKPANLLIDRKGVVRILDMGLARLEEPIERSAKEPSGDRLTASGQMMGTWDYMAPEQAEDTRRADHRADIYSLGCTLYRLLTGVPPYAGETVVQVLLAHREQEIPSLRAKRPDVPAELDAVFQKMVAKQTADRYQSMREVIAELHAAVAETAPASVGGESSTHTLLTAFFDVEHAAEATPAGTATATRDTASFESEQETGTSRRGHRPHRGPVLKRLLVCLGVLAGLAILARLMIPGNPAADPNPKEAVGLDGSSGGAKIAPKANKLAADATMAADAASKQEQSPGEPMDKADWIDLLGRVDPAEDAVEGLWQRSDLRLQATRGRSMPVLALPVLLSGSYTLRTTFVRDEEDGTVALVLPVGPTNVALILDSEHGSSAGLDLIKGFTVGQEGNPTTLRRGALRTGQRYLVEADVQLRGDTATITVELDDDPYLSFEGPLDQLSLSPGWKLPDRRAVAIAVGAATSFETVRLKLHDGQGWLPRPDESPAESSSSLVEVTDQPVDLLPLVHPQRDGVAGEWRFDGEALVVEPHAYARLKIPYIPPEEYRLEVEVTRTTGNGPLVLGFVAAGHQGQLLVGQASGHSGLGALERSENETWQRSGVFKNGETSTLVCVVRWGHLLAHWDGRKILDWKGNADRLSNRGYFSVGDTRVLFLGGENSGFRIAKLQLTPLSGKGRALAARPRAPQRVQANLLTTLDAPGGRIADQAYSPDGTKLASVAGSKILLWNPASEDRPAELTGHSGAIHAISFSPDGKTLASASSDNSIKLWDLQGDQSPRTLKAHTAIVWSLAFSPDGNTLASSGEDKAVILFDLPSGEPRVTLKTQAPASCLVFAPDGETFASSGIDGAIKLRDARTGESVRTLAGHRNAVHSLAFSPDGVLLASAGDGKTIKLWDVASGEERYSLEGHTDAIRSVAFSADGRILASAGDDQTVRLWDVLTGEDRLALREHSGAVRSVAFSPVGNRLATAGDDQKIRLWSAESGRRRLTLRGHASGVSGVAAAPNGETIASSSWDRTIRIWDAKSGIERRVLRGGGEFKMAVAYAPDGKHLASAGDNKQISIWNLETGKPGEPLVGHTSRVASVAYSPDGRTIASASHDQTIKLWDIASGEDRKTLKGHTSAVLGVAFSPDGKSVASCGRDRSVRIWDAATGSEQHLLKGHGDHVQGVAFSPDGKTLASAGFDRTAKLWDAQTGQLLRTLEGHAAEVHSVAFSPNGKTLATGSWDRTIKFWDIQSGAELATLRGHRDRIDGLAFSPDGSTLVSGSSDRTIRTWDAETRGAYATLIGHTGPVHGTAFSPHGDLLASAGDDWNVMLWNPLTANQDKLLKGHQGPVRSVAFSPDGALLASAGDDRIVRLWDPQTGDPGLLLKGHTGRVNVVAFSPDGETLASASDDLRIRFWNPHTGKQRALTEPHISQVRAMAFHPNGATVFSSGQAHYDRTVMSWNALTGRGGHYARYHHSKVLTIAISPSGLLATAGLDHNLGIGNKLYYSGHARAINSLAFAPSGKTLASASSDDSIKLWDVPKRRQRAQLLGHTGEVLHVSFSPDGTTLASASSDRTIKLWDVADDETQPDPGSELIPGKQPSGHQLARFDGEIRVPGTPLSVATYSHDNRLLASCGSNRQIVLWDVQERKRHKTLRGETNPVNCVAFSPDGSTLASASADRTVLLWDVETGEPRHRLSGHTTFVNFVAYSPDGKTLASAAEDGTIRLWDAETGTYQKTLRGHERFVHAVAFSPDGKTLASAGADKTVRLWNLASDEEPQVLREHTASVRSVAYSPDGKTLASAGDDRTVILWDAQVGLPRQTLTGHQGSVSAVAFSPNGKMLASGSSDNTVKLWSLATGESLRSLGLHQNSVSSVAFSSDGKTLISAGRDALIVFWSVQPTSKLAPGQKPQPK